MVYSRGRVLDRGGLEIRHRGSSEARGEDTDESGDSAEREQIGGLYLLDIGGHEFRESVRRRETGGRNYWVSSLYICKHTNCPAVLTENLFQDNREDVDYLLSDAGKQAIVRLHVKGIIDYLNSL